MERNKLERVVKPGQRLTNSPVPNLTFRRFKRGSKDV
jgi:hypothetical protein